MGRVNPTSFKGNGKLLLIGEYFVLESFHARKFKDLTPYGVFVELNDGIVGMIRFSDLSWT